MMFKKNSGLLMGFKKFFNLSFEDQALESRFLEEFSKKAVSTFRHSIALGIITFLYFSFVDTWSLPKTAKLAINIRLFLTAPLLILFWLSSFHKKFYKYIDLITSMSAILAAGSISYMIFRADRSEPGYDTYYVGILLVNVWISSYLKTRFRSILIIVAINNLIYILIAVLHQDYISSHDQTRLHVFFTNLSFFIPTTFISMLACRESEVYARNGFLQNEHLIEQQAKLVDTNRLAAVGEMAAGIAHEINNPLSIIVSSIRSINQRISSDDFDKENIEVNLRRISSSSNRIVSIVKSLKLYSRDGSHDEFKVENLESVILDSIFYVQEKFNHNGIKLDISEIPQVKIRCKISSISQVLINLLNNAYDAVLDGVENPEIKIGFFVYNHMIEIQISDNGPGIPSEIREKIMNPFFTTKPAGKGSGLGLSLSRDIVEQHGGELKLLNTFKGANFIFTLPIV